VGHKSRRYSTAPSNVTYIGAIFFWTKHARAISNYAEKSKLCSLPTQAHVVGFKLPSIQKFMTSDSPWSGKWYLTIESWTRSAAAEWAWCTGQRTSSSDVRLQLNFCQMSLRTIP